MRLRYTRLALSDLREAEEFIRAQNPTAAAAMMRRLATAIDHLTIFPESGRRGRAEGTRELIVPSTPFVIAYRVTAGTIDILAVVHAARRWPSGFGPD